MGRLLVLPDFLMSYDEMQQVKIPQMKDFSYEERDPNNDESFNGQWGLESAEQIDRKRKQRNKRLCVSIAVVLLVAFLILAIYFSI